MNRQGESTDEYVLIEELFNIPQPPPTSPSPKPPDTSGQPAEPTQAAHPLLNVSSITTPASQRILNPEDQLIGSCVANWNGAKGRFVLRKKGSVSAFLMLGKIEFEALNKI